MANADAPADRLKDALFRALVSGSPRPILITNDLVEIEYVNDAWIRQFGYSLAEVMGKNPRVIQSGKTPRSVFQRMWRQLKRGEVFQSDKIIDRRKDGSNFHIFTTTFPVRVDDSLHYVQILDDVSARKSHEKAQELYLNVAAHDIRSPLANLKILGELMALDKNIYAEENLRSLNDEIQRLSRLVKILLDPELFKSEALVLRKTKVDVRETLQRAIRAASLKSRSQEIVLVLRKHLSVHADEDRLQQVLVNLLENAIKYASGKEPIRVAARTQGRRVVISVSDRGPGISKAEAGRIFDAFYRTQHGMKSAQGFGLGLHIAHRIIRAHRGRILVRPRKGGGSTFSFTLPLSA